MHGCDRSDDGGCCARALCRHGRRPSGASGHVLCLHGCSQSADGGCCACAQEWATAKWGTWAWERVDAGVPAAERHAAVARFNGEGSRAVTFLLSARACGLGIDLPSVSTVIVLDSDWNPRCSPLLASDRHGHASWLGGDVESARVGVRRRSVCCVSTPCWAGMPGGCAPATHA